MTSLEVRAAFPADPASAAQARRFLEERLRGWQCQHLVDVATLLVSELVANAILHAGSTIEVAAKLTDDRVRIEVYDDNPRMPVRKHYSTMSATGRGLLLVERLARAWGSDATPWGKRVWFELDQQPAAGAEEADLFAFDAFDLDELAPAERGRPSPDEGSGRGGGGSPRLMVRVKVPW